VSLFPTPAPDFDDPVGLLAACHQRVLYHCDLLERLCTLLPTTPDCLELNELAAAVHRYFAVAAPHHHQDEEQDLFPRLAEQPQLAPLLEALAAEHVRQDALWAELEPGLANPTRLAPRDFIADAKAFIASQRAHVELENAELLPAAAQLLDPEALARMGLAMARRRGVSHHRGQL